MNFPFSSFLSAFCLIALVSACGTPEKETKAPVNCFSDQNLVKLYEAKDRRDADSIIALVETFPQYTNKALMAFGTLQDSAATSWLTSYLKNENASLRASAAFALGQSKDRAALSALLEVIPDEKNSDVQIEMWSALGQLAEPEDSTDVISLFDAGSNDNFSWCLYRIAARGKMVYPFIPHIFHSLQSKNDLTRLGAANTLGRLRGFNLNDFEAELQQALNAEKNTEVRIALALATKNTRTQKVKNAVEQIIGNQHEDYRVLISALRSYGQFENAQWSKVETLVSHEQMDVALTAAGLSRLCRTKGDLNTIIEGTLPAQVRAVVLSNHPDYVASRLDIVISWIENADNSYVKSHWISALNKSANAIPFLVEMMTRSNDAPVSTAACESLIAIKESKLWPETEDFKEVINLGFNTQDVTILGLFALHIKNPGFNYSDEPDIKTWIETAKSQLNLPMEIETYYELESALAYLNEEEWIKPLPEWNHPIDWELVQHIPNNQMAVVKTSKGSFEIKLDVEAAPGSVSNFVQLVKDGYYSNKYFHRVVPNFVIQTGCPRGDGWGSTDYTIRSEFDLHDYRTGAVGMASAGKDTESCQWFVSHSPTPHLDGRYSIFGYVTNGMDVVHNVQVGDQIIEILLP